MTLHMSGHQSHVTDVQFWKYALSSASADGTVRMWDSTHLPFLVIIAFCGVLTSFLVRTGTCHRTIRTNQVTANCLHFTETAIVSGGGDNTVKVRYDHVTNDHVD